jgi:hypothetical protein
MLRHMHWVKSILPLAMTAVLLLGALPSQATVLNVKIPGFTTEAATIKWAQNPSSAPNPIALASGVPTTGSIAAADPNSCAPGSIQYTIQVPTGATELAIALVGNQADNLLVSFGQPVTVLDGQAVADFIANSPGVNQSLTIGPSSSPPLQQGTYYIAVGNCSTAPYNFTLTADVVGGTISTFPSIAEVSADLEGDTLTLTGTAQDLGGDMTEADVVFLDGDGNPLGTTTPFQYAFGTDTSVVFTITVQGMERYLQALQVSMTVIDSQGNTSPAVTASFANGDPGGPQMNLILFDGLDSLLTIKGTGFKSPVQLEVNGVIVAPPLRVKVKGGTKKKGGTKLLIPGTGPDLNLQNGFNRIRVISNGLRSQLIVISI